MFSIIEKISVGFIEKGWDQVVKNKEFQRLQEAIRGRIARELRFNDELLRTILKHRSPDDAELLRRLTESLHTSAFDAVCDAAVPLKIIVGQSNISKDDWKVIQEKFPYPSTNYLKWASNICDSAMLTERIYHRSKIIKLFNSLDISKNQQSIKYVLFLIRAFFQTTK